MIVTNRKKYLKWSFRPTFRGEKQLDHGLIMIENDKCRIKLYKQSHIGASIFELNKVLMCNFHYNFIEKKYDVEAELLFTDTGNWMYEIETLNV